MDIYNNTQLELYKTPNFYSVTYCPECFHSIIVGISSIIFLICFGLRTLITNTKKLSWGLTLVNSFVMTTASTFYIYTKRQQIINYLQNGNGAYELLQSVDDFSVIFCIWFALMNFADILFGMIFYFKYLGFTTAIIHHPLYIWIMITCITGNGIIVNVKPFASGCMILTIEELPTFILALGTIFPQFRTDIGFGMSFFLLRICLHSYILYSIINLQFGMTPIVLLSITNLFHIYWFYLWINKYGSSLFKYSN